MRFYRENPQVVLAVGGQETRLGEFSLIEIVHSRVLPLLRFPRLFLGCEQGAFVYQQRSASLAGWIDEKGKHSGALCISSGLAKETRAPV